VQAAARRLSQGLADTGGLAFMNPSTDPSTKEASQERNGGPSSRLSPEEERDLWESKEEIRRGEFIDGQDLLNELRSRRS
jgi:hypothetical protein